MDRCITREEVDNNGTPYTTQIVYNYEFIDDFDEPQLGRLGNFLLNTALRCKKRHPGQEIPLIMLNLQPENGDERVVNIDKKAENDENLRSSSITSAKRPSTVSSGRKFSVIPLDINWGPNIYDKDNHTMALMVRVIFSLFTNSR